MIKEGLLAELKASAGFFERSSSVLSEEDSNFTPRDGMYSVSHHVAHTARTIDWFIEGMFAQNGFDMDFELHIKQAKACNSLTEARKWFKKSIAQAIEVIDSKTDKELQEALPKNTVMGGAPRLAVMGAIVEHMAHHRGALTVYSRLLGKAPQMPYGDF